MRQEGSWGSVFAHRQMTIQNATTSTTTVTMTVDESATIDFCKPVMDKINDASFLEEHKDSRAPLAMLALVVVIVEMVINAKDDNLTFKYFDEMTFTVPDSKDAVMLSHCRSIVGQKLLCVNWQKNIRVGSELSKMSYWDS